MYFCEIILKSKAFIENDLIISLINELYIKHCIIVEDDYSNIISYKYFVKRNINTIYMDKEYFWAYLEWGYYLDVKTAIVIKTEGMIQVFNDHFHKVRKLQNNAANVNTDPTFKKKFIL